MAHLSNKELKSKTILWLEWHLQEMLQNRLAMTISKEDEAENEKTSEEIKACIEWVKNKKS